MSDSLGIALLGCGTVGTGVARLLLEQPDRWRHRTGRSLHLRRVLVRDLDRPRGIPLPPGTLTTSLGPILDDPEIQVVVELMGGTAEARHYVLASLAAGKHVVTANKALLAEFGTEVFQAAYAAERTIAFEASVAGGIPIIATMSQSLAANQICSLQGILNGTCNFILSQMAEQGQTYCAALSAAQTLGYAEADPTLDVDGSDAVHKLTILARLSFGFSIPPSAIPKRGIEGMHSMDLKFAHELGYTIKLLAEAWLHTTDPDESGTTSQVALHVSPVLIRSSQLLARVPGVHNALQIVGDVVGEMLLQGPGAGQMPTASAVLADLLDLATGRAQRTFHSLRLWASPNATFPARDPHLVRTRFYLRLLAADRPGTLAEITRALADEQISITSIIQHEALEDHEGELVPLVIMTHTAETGRFYRALDRINQLPAVNPPSVAYPVADG